MINGINTGTSNIYNAYEINNADFADNYSVYNENIFDETNTGGGGTLMPII